MINDKVMKKITIAIMVCCFFTAARGQEVKFHSSAVENGIRSHLQIGSGANITFEQLDTITRLDLSGMGVSDIRDMNMMPNLKWLNLSNNEVDEVYSLILLDSLEWLDLSFNVIENIDPLSCSSAKAITIDVTGNYIRDFSAFSSILPCSFTFEGAGMQETRNPSYFSIDELYCNSSEDDVVVYGRVSTNTSGTAKLCYLNNESVVPTDGNLFSRVIAPDTDETFPIIIINDTIFDSTYYVPPSEVTLKAFETVTVETGLPDNYSISLCNPTEQGSISVEGSKLVYTASGLFQKDEITFSYSVGSTLKGFSKIKFLSDGSGGSGLAGDVNGDNAVNITDISLIVSHILGETLPIFLKENADMNNDKSINVTDVMNVVNIVLNTSSPRAPANARYDMDNMVVLTGNNHGCSIFLDGNAPFTGCEMTLTLPEGCTLLDATLDSHQPTSHQVAVQSIGDGRYRLVVYAPTDGRSRLAEGALVNLGLNGRSENIKVSDIMFCNHQYETVVLQDAIGITTSLDGIRSSDDTAPTYSIQGVKTPMPRRGVYIKGHKKKAVKN